jgi:hypothetical protein
MTGCQVPRDISPPYDGPVVYLAQQSQPDRDWHFVVHRRVESVLRHFLSDQTQPGAPRATAVIPVQSGMSSRYLQAAADQQADEENVDIVRQAQPQRKTE